MYIKAILITIFCPLLFVNCKAQTDNKFEGIIIDGNTNLPIEGVYIKSSNNESNAVTDKIGFFLILFTKKISNNDSIIINGLGYKTIKLPISTLNNEPIKLYEEVATLPEVLVQSLFNWGNFAKKVKIEFAAVPFESDFQKNISIKQNSEKTKEYNFKGKHF